MNPNVPAEVCVCVWFLVTDVFTVPCLTRIFRIQTSPFGFHRQFRHSRDQFNKTRSDNFIHSPFKVHNMKGLIPFDLSPKLLN
jgi:hypothetical protein